MSASSTTDTMKSAEDESFEQLAAMFFDDEFVATINDAEIWDVIGRSSSIYAPKFHSPAKRKISSTSSPQKSEIGSNLDKINKFRFDQDIDPDEHLWRLLLLRTPKLLTEAFNVGDIISMQAIINAVCDSDFIVQIGQNTPELVGRHHFLDLFQQSLETIPDAVCITSPATMQDGVVTAPIVFTGTKLFETKHAKFTSLNDEGKSIRKIEAEGGICNLYKKGSLNLCLGSKRLKFVKVFYLWEEVEVTRMVMDLNDCDDGSSKISTHSQLLSSQPAIRTATAIPSQSSAIVHNENENMRAACTPLDCNDDEQSIVSQLSSEALSEHSASSISPISYSTEQLAQRSKSISILRKNAIDSTPIPSFL